MTDFWNKNFNPDRTKKREPNKYQAGSLRFNSDGPRPAKKLFSHIHNDIQPKSIFEDRSYIPECLFKLCDIAESEFSAKTLETETWLNSLPRWNELFPKEWITNMGNDNTDIQRSLNFWGQFVNAKGGFNHKYADMMRKAGEFPFPSKLSWCHISSLREHLDSYLKQ